MKYKNKKWLYEMYINKKYKCQEIADLCNVSKTTILMWLYKFNIRHPRKRKENIDNRYKDKVFLYQKHIIEQMPMQDIANLCNVSLDAIRYNLRKNGIPIWRSYPPKDLSKYACEIIYKYVNERKSALQLAKEYDCCTTAIKIVLRKNDIPIRNYSDAQLARYGDVDARFYDEEWLRTAHWSIGLSIKDISKILHVGERSIRSRMHAYSIPTRTNSESKIGLMTGDKHPNWKGGITSLSALLREYLSSNINPKVLERDNYKCQLCGSKKNLHIHHIISFSKIIKDILDDHPEYDVSNIYDKVQLYKIIVNDPRFLSTDNLITYCKACHLFKIHKYQKKR